MDINEYEFFFKIKKEMFYGGSIRVNPNNLELYYHYPWGSNSKTEMTEVKDIQNIEITNGYLPDHISFHKDGNVHSKARDGKKKNIYLNKTNPGFNVFNLKMKHYFPFFIESINISEIEFIHKRFEKNIYFEPLGPNGFDVSKYNSFSIVLISYCEKVSIEYIFKDEVLKNLNIISSCNINGIFTKDDKRRNFKIHSGFHTNLLILIVEKVWGKFEEITHPITKEKGLLFSNCVCLPSENDMIKNMINLN
ncbi:MAG: hypothetical protein V4497_09925 [Bacteroidota bacterium]